MVSREKLFNRKSQQDLMADFDPRDADGIVKGK